MAERTTNNKSLLIRTVVLAAAFIAVVAGMVVMTRGETSANQSVGTQTFLEQFVISGGPIVWFILMPASVVMVYLAVQYLLTIRRAVLLPGDADREVVVPAGHLSAREYIDSLGGRGDFVSTAVARSVSHGAGDWFKMRDACFESLQEQAISLVRKIEWLNLIGNVSPMVGLFGTVFGMIKLFNSIVTSGGQPAPAQLAGGISVALVTTFWGLAIAIPALALYGIFRNRIEILANEALAMAEEVLPKVRRRLIAQQKQQLPEQPLPMKPPIRKKRSAENITPSAAQ